MNEPVDSLLLTDVYQWDVFVRYCGLHLAALAACVFMIAVVADPGRSLRTNQAKLKLRRLMAIFALCYWVAYKGWGAPCASLERSV